jgi:dienelactone hydrolase
MPRAWRSCPTSGGLHPFYEELALRFGDAGVHALALDYYGRTAGTGSRGGDLDHTPHLQQATDDNVGRDVAAPVPTWANPTSTVYLADGCHGMCCSLPMWCYRRSPGAAAPFGLFLAGYASVQARCGPVSGPV